jgi:hypothetical protein
VHACDDRLLMLVACGTHCRSACHPEMPYNTSLNPPTRCRPFIRTCANTTPSSASHACGSRLAFRFRATFARRKSCNKLCTKQVCLIAVQSRARESDITDVLLHIAPRHRLGAARVGISAGNESVAVALLHHPLAHPIRIAISTIHNANKPLRVFVQGITITIRIGIDLGPSERVAR